MFTLDTLTPGQSATIAHLDGEGIHVQRLLEMGLLPGQAVELIGRAPLGDPLAIHIRGGRLAVRKADARRIRIQLDAHHSPAPARRD